MKIGKIKLKKKAVARWVIILASISLILTSFIPFLAVLGK